MSRIYQILKSFQDTFKRNSLLSCWFQQPRYLLCSHARGYPIHKGIKYRKEIVYCVRKAICYPGRKLDTSFLLEIPPTLIFIRELSNRYMIPELCTFKTELKKTIHDDKSLLLISRGIKKNRIKRLHDRKSYNENRKCNVNGNELVRGITSLEPNLKLASLNKKTKTENVKQKNFFKAILSKFSLPHLDTKNAMVKKKPVKSNFTMYYSKFKQSGKLKDFNEINDSIKNREQNCSLQQRNNTEKSQPINNVITTETTDNKKNLEKCKLADSENKLKKHEDRSQIRRHKQQNAIHEKGDEQTLKLKAKMFEKIHKPEVDFYIKKLAAKYGKINDEKKKKPQRTYENNRQRITYDVKEDINNKHKMGPKKHILSKNIDSKILSYSKKRFNDLLKTEIEKIKILKPRSNAEGKWRTILNKSNSMVKKELRNLQHVEEKVKKGTIFRKEKIIANRMQGEILKDNINNHEVINLNINNGLLEGRETSCTDIEKLWVQKEMEKSKSLPETTPVQVVKENEILMTEHKKKIYSGDENRTISKENNIKRDACENNAEPRKEKANSKETLVCHSKNNSCNRMEFKSHNNSESKANKGIDNEFSQRNKIMKVENVNINIRRDTNTQEKHIVNQDDITFKEGITLKNNSNDNRKYKITDESTKTLEQSPKIEQSKPLTLDEIRDSRGLLENIKIIDTNPNRDNEMSKQLTKKLENQKLKSFHSTKDNKNSLPNNKNQSVQFTPIAKFATIPKQKVVTRKYKMTRFPPIVNSDKSPGSEKNPDLKVNHGVESENKQLLPKENIKLHSMVEFKNAIIQKLPIPIKTLKFNGYNEILDYRVYACTFNLSETMKSKQDNKHRELEKLNDDISLKRNRAINPETSQKSKRPTEENKRPQEKVNKCMTEEGSSYSEDNKRYPTINLEKSNKKNFAVCSKKGETVNMKKKETVDKSEKEIINSYVNLIRKRIPTIANLEHIKPRVKNETSKGKIHEVHSITRSEKKSNLPMTLFRVYDNTNQAPSLEKKTNENTPIHKEMTTLKIITLEATEETVDREKENNTFSSSKLKPDAGTEGGLEEKKIQLSDKQLDEERKIIQGTENNNINSTINSRTSKGIIIEHTEKNNWLPSTKNLKGVNNGHGNAKDNERFIVVINLKQESRECHVKKTNTIPQYKNLKTIKNVEEIKEPTVIVEITEETLRKIDKNNDLGKKENKQDITNKDTERSKISLSFKKEEVTGGSVEENKIIPPITEVSENKLMSTCSNKSKQNPSIANLDSTPRREENTGEINKNINKGTFKKEDPKIAKGEANKSLGNSLSNKNKVTTLISALANTAVSQNKKPLTKLFPIMYLEEVSKKDISAKQKLISETKINKEPNTSNLLDNKQTFPKDQLSSDKKQKISQSIQHDLVSENKNLLSSNMIPNKTTHEVNKSLPPPLAEREKKDSITDISLGDINEYLRSNHIITMPEKQEKIARTNVDSTKMEGYVSKFVDIVINKNILGEAARKNIFLMHGLNKVSFLKILFEIQHVTSEKPILIEKNAKMESMKIGSTKKNTTSLDKLEILENDLKTLINKQMDLNMAELKKRQLERSKQKDKLSIYNLFDYIFILKSFNKVSFNEIFLKRVFFEESHQYNIIKDTERIPVVNSTAYGTNYNKKINIMEETKGYTYEVMKHVKELISDDKGSKINNQVSSKHMSFYSKYRMNFMNDKEVSKNVKDMNDKESEAENIDSTKINSLQIGKDKYSYETNCSDDYSKEINFRQLRQYSQKMIENNYGININKDLKNNLHQEAKFKESINVISPSKNPHLEKSKLKDFMLKDTNEMKKKSYCTNINSEPEIVKSTILFSGANSKEYYNIGKVEPEVLNYIHKLQNMNMVVTSKKGLTTMTTPHSLAPEINSMKDVLNAEEINKNITSQDAELITNRDSIKVETDKNLSKEVGTARRKKCFITQSSYLTDIKILENPETDVFSIIKDCKIGNFKYLTSLIHKKKVNTRILSNNNLAQHDNHEIIKESKISTPTISHNKEIKNIHKVPSLIDDQHENNKNETVNNELNFYNSRNVNTIYEVYIKTESPNSKTSIKNSTLDGNQISMSTPNMSGYRNNAAADTTDKQASNDLDQIKITNIELPLNPSSKRVSTKYEQVIMDYLGKESKNDTNKNSDKLSPKFDKINLDKAEIIKDTNTNEIKSFHTNYPKDKVSYIKDEVFDHDSKSMINKKGSMSEKKRAENTISHINKSSKLEVGNFVNIGKENNEPLDTKPSLSNDRANNTSGFNLANSTLKNNKNDSTDMKHFRTNGKQSLCVSSNTPTQNKFEGDINGFPLNKKMLVDNNPNNKITELKKSTGLSSGLNDKTTLCSNKSYSPKPEIHKDTNISSDGKKISFKEICLKCENNREETNKIAKSECLNKPKQELFNKKEKNKQIINFEFKNDTANLTDKCDVETIVKRKNGPNNQTPRVHDIKPNFRTKINESKMLQIHDKNDINFQNPINKDIENTPNKSKILKKDQEDKIEAIKMILYGKENDKFCVDPIISKPLEFISNRNVKTDMGSPNQSLLTEHIPSGSRCIKQLHTGMKQDKEPYEASSTEYIAQTNKEHHIIEKKVTQMEQTPNNNLLNNIVKPLTGERISSKVNKFLLVHKKKLEKITKNKQINSIKTKLSNNLKPKDDVKIIHKPPHTLMSLLNTESDRKRSYDNEREVKQRTGNERIFNNKHSLPTIQDIEKFRCYNKPFSDSNDTQKLMPISNSSKEIITHSIDSISPDNNMKFINQYNEHKVKNFDVPRSNFNEHVQEKLNRKEVIIKNKTQGYCLNRNIKADTIKSYRGNQSCVMKQQRNDRFISHLCPSKLHSEVNKKRHSNYSNSINHGKKCEVKQMEPAVSSHKICKCWVLNENSRNNKNAFKKSHRKEQSRSVANIFSQNDIKIQPQLFYKEQKRLTTKHCLLDAPSRLACGIIHSRQIQKTKPVLLKQKLPIKLLTCTNQKIERMSKMKSEKKIEMNELEDRDALLSESNKFTTDTQSKQIFPEICCSNEGKTSIQSAPVQNINKSNVNDPKVSLVVNKKIDETKHLNVAKESIKVNSIYDELLNPNESMFITGSAESVKNDEFNTKKNSNSPSLVDTVVNNVKVKLQNWPSSVSKAMSPAVPQRSWFDLTDIVKNNTLLKRTESIKRWQKKIYNIQNQIRQNRNLETSKVNDIKNGLTKMRQKEIKGNKSNALLLVSSDSQEKSSLRNKYSEKMNVKCKNKSRGTFHRRRRISEMLKIKTLTNKNTCPQMSYSEVLNKFYAGTES